MYKVIREFHDKNDLKKIYKVGDEFSSNEPDRIKNLLDRGLIEGTSVPSVDSMAKKELMELLEEKGIGFDAKQTKAELIELLQGGG